MSHSALLERCAAYERSQRGFLRLLLHHSLAREKYRTAVSAQRCVFQQMSSEGQQKANDAYSKIDQSLFEFVGFGLRSGPTCHLPFICHLINRSLSFCVRYFGNIVLLALATRVRLEMKNEK
jgi:hypothetical protein